MPPAAEGGVSAMGEPCHVPRRDASVPARDTRDGRPQGHLPSDAAGARRSADIGTAIVDTTGAAFA